MGLKFGILTITSSFSFLNQVDVTQIIQSEPWFFDKHLVVLEKLDSDTEVRELQFQKLLELQFMTKEVVENICDIIGEVSRSIGGVVKDGGNFIRVRVTLDISLSLCRGQLVSFWNGKKFWVRFRYERLPNICYWCGRLNDGDC